MAANLDSFLVFRFPHIIGLHLLTSNFWNYKFSVYDLSRK